MSYVTEDFENMIIAIMPDDPVQVFIKGHLILESKLINLIELCLKNKNEIDVAKLRFPIKVDLAYALGAIQNKDLKNILYSINTFRNKFAHNIDYQLDDKDISKLFNGKSNTEKFYKSLFFEDKGKDYFEIFKVIFAITCKALDEEEKRIKGIN